jgi:hypothetical protein
MKTGKKYLGIFNSEIIERTDVAQSSLPIQGNHVRFEALTAVTMKSDIL